MKNKASLVLMEQLVMILVFALASALCLEIFVRAQEISQETARFDQAVVLAKNAAELLKATSGNTECVENLSSDGYQITVIPQPVRQPGLASAEIQIVYEHQLLFSLHTGWQEVLP